MGRDDMSMAKGNEIVRTSTGRREKKSGGGPDGQTSKNVWKPAEAFAGWNS